MEITSAEQDRYKATTYLLQYNVTFPDTCKVSSQDSCATVMMKLNVCVCVCAHVCMQLAAQSACLKPFLLDENMVKFNKMYYQHSCNQCGQRRTSKRY
jgi:hypothetical protein